MVFVGQTRFLWIFAGKIVHRRQVFLGRARRIGLIHDAAQESKAVNLILFWEECDRISVRWAVPNLNNEKKAPWKRCSTGLLKINRGIIYFYQRTLCSRGLRAPAEAPAIDAAKPSKDPTTNDHNPLAALSAMARVWSAVTLGWLGTLTPPS